MTLEDDHLAGSNTGATPPLDRTATTRGVIALFYTMAFCSGAAALVYEITWARMLGLTFGSTTLSAAAVIAGFMGGTGLGAWLYHLGWIGLRGRCRCTRRWNSASLSLPPC